MQGALHRRLCGKPGPVIVCAKIIYAERILYMWSYEHAVETTAAPERIWALWSDVAGWPTWNADIEAISIDGPFTAGSEIAMTLAGQDTVRLRIAEAHENELFVDEARIGDGVIRTLHRIDRLADGRVRVVYRTEITEPEGGQLGAQLGPAITADFPETLAALVERAQA
jgi:Polyketide cyclase / dehydrase and lipid transport